MARSYNEQWREGGYVIDFKVGQSFGEPHGQQRTNRKKTALAAEPCCVSDCKSLMEFQGHTTTPQGWPELKDNSNRLKTLDSGTVLAQ